MWREALAIVVSASSLLAAACANAAAPAAYGNVEAREVVVSSEVAGQLTSFTVDEGGICIFTLSDSSGTSEGDGQGDWVDTYSSSGGTNTITVHTTLTATTGSP